MRFIKRISVIWLVAVASVFCADSYAAREFDEPSGDGMQVSSAGVTGVPITISAWFRTTPTGNADTLVSIVNSADTDDRFALIAVNESSVRANTRQASGPTTANADTSVGYSASTWYHAAGVWVSTSERHAFLNGGSKGSESATTVTPASIDETCIGLMGGDAPTNRADARIAEACIWNVALSDGEIAAIAAGVNPIKFRPQNIVGYYPVWGVFSPDLDVGDSRAMTVTGTTLTNHSPTAPMNLLRFP